MISARIAIRRRRLYGCSLLARLKIVRCRGRFPPAQPIVADKVRHERLTPLTTPAPQPWYLLTVRFPVHQRQISLARD
jgi:hypothetical protein